MTEKKNDTNIKTQTTQTEEAQATEAPQQGNMLRAVLKFFIAVVAVFAIAFGLRTFVFSPYEIPSGSMENTILVGDMVFAEKVSYGLGGKPQPGQIVTFKDPQKADRTLIKRVIATEGQEVDLIDGKVYIDGQELAESYVDSSRKTFPLSTAPGVEIDYPYVVPEDHIWVMGDNRTASSDSRYFGSVPVSSVTGHANFRYWPLNRAGFLG